MSARYKPIGESRLERFIKEEGFCITETVSDLEDRRTGVVYYEGHHRVVIWCAERIPGAPRSKSFEGETAWSNARRYVEDAHRFFERQAV